MPALEKWELEDQRARATLEDNTNDCVPGDTPRCCFVGRCLNFLIQETQALLGEGRDQSVRCWVGVDSGGHEREDKPAHLCQVAMAQWGF